MKYIILFLAFIGFFSIAFKTFSQGKIKIKNNELKMKSKDWSDKDSKLAGATDSTDRKELERLTIVWRDAILNRDSTLLNKLVAPEYKLQRYNGSTPVYRVTWFDNLYHHLKINQWEQTGVYAQVYRNVGIVTSLYAWTGTFFDRPFDSKGYLADMWVKRNGQWQVYSRTNGTFEGSITLDHK